MLAYQRRTLNPVADVGPPGDLPRNLRGLSDASLANLPAALHPQAITALGYANTGFFPVEVADPVVIPEAVTRLQFTVALQAMGAYDNVAAAITAMPTNNPIKLYFLNAAVFRRDDERLIAFGTYMNQSAAQVDAIFVAAAAVPA